MIGLLQSDYLSVIYRSSDRTNPVVTDIPTEVLDHSSRLFIIDVRGPSERAARLWVPEGCMLSDKDIDTLLYYLDRGIREEIERICNVPAASGAYDRLLTTEDAAFAKALGIAL
jgi:hypothetical protein